MKKFTLILISVLLLSCETEEINEPYYNFSDSDLDKSLNLQLNETIKFKNQFNEYISYDINEVSSDFMRSWSDGSWVISSWTILYFYYDEKIIILNSNSTDNFIKYKFNRLPINIEQAEKNRFTKFPSKFNSEVYFHLWNGIDDRGRIIIDYEKETESKIINGKKYQNVIKIESGNNNPINNNPSKNVNIIYYDINYGIVGYDDLNNNKWRITN